ncbi:MAG: HDOD domain-containing protein [Myxococcota bacterium]
MERLAAVPGDGPLTRLWRRLLGREAATRPAPRARPVSVLVARSHKESVVPADSGSDRPALLSADWLATVKPQTPPLEPWEEAQLDPVYALVVERFPDAVRALPPLSPLAAQCAGLIQNPNTSVQEVVRFVSRDPLVAAQVLRLANSAHYSRGETVVGVRDAVVRLGFREVYSLVMALSCVGAASGDGSGPVEHANIRGNLWRHALTSAFAAGQLSMVIRRGDLDVVFLGGLLHDVGKVVGLRILAQLAQEEALPVPLGMAFTLRMLEAVHVRVGADLLAHWRLPPEIQRVCVDHHRREDVNGAEHASTHVVRVVSGAHELLTSAYCSERVPQEVLQSALALDMDDAQLRLVANHVQEAGLKAELVLGSSGRVS